MRLFTSILILVSVTLLGACTEEEGGYPRRVVPFTVPFERGVVLGVSDVESYAVELALATPKPVRAPNHVIVERVRPGGVDFLHYEEEARLVLDGLDEIFIHTGEEVCAGEVVGETLKVRLMAYREGEEISDLSLVRAIRDLQG